MLIKCPECELQVSDKAVSCPHCGYPMQSSSKSRKPRNKTTNDAVYRTDSDKSARLKTVISAILSGRW